MNNKPANNRFALFVPRKWQLPLLLIGVVIVLQLLSMNRGENEWRYSTGMYRHISRVLRWFTGWIPFSIGDVLYISAICYLLVKTGKFVKMLFRRKMTKAYLKHAGRKLLVISLSTYIIFLVLWGFNYRRRGITKQLELEVKAYSTADLDTVLTIVSNRLTNLSDSQQNRQALYKQSYLFSEGAKMYREEYVPYPFMEMYTPSIKSSLFGKLGNYLGFQGYYNPFTGEAQINTTVPVYMQPDIVCHELAHQAGYAKENEANFVGYLASKSSPNPCFRYSAYFDMFMYGILEMEVRDSAISHRLIIGLPRQVKDDIAEWQRFRKQYKSPFESVIMWFYGQYLKANNMPQGVATYNQVIAWLIAYYKKYGAAVV